MLKAGGGGGGGADASSAATASGDDSAAGGDSSSSSSSSLTSPRTRATTSSAVVAPVKRQLSSGTGVVRAAGRGKTPSVRGTSAPRSPRGGVGSDSAPEDDSPAPVPVPASGVSGKRTSVETPSTIKTARAPPPATSVKRLSGAVTPELGRTKTGPKLSLDELEDELNFEIDVSQKPAQSNNQPNQQPNQQQQPNGQQQNQAPAASPTVASGWGFVTALTSAIWAGDKRPAPPPSGTSPRREEPPPPPPTSAPTTTEKGKNPRASRASAAGKKRDSMSLLEELLELTESVDALRVMVADQGSQLREQEEKMKRQEDLINALLSRVNTLEEKSDM